MRNPKQWERKFLIRWPQCMRPEWGLLVLLMAGEQIGRVCAKTRRQLEDMLRVSHQKLPEIEVENVAHGCSFIMKALAFMGYEGFPFSYEIIARECERTKITVERR